MSLINPRTEAEKQKEAAKQIRFMMAIERAVEPRLKAEINRYGREASKAFETGIQSKIHAATVAHQKRVQAILSAAYKLSIERSAKYTIDQLGKSFRRWEKKEADDFISEMIAQWIRIQGLASSKSIADTDSRVIVNEVIFKGVNDGLGESAIGKMIKTQARNISTQRARLIARTEVHNASIGANMAIVEEEAPSALKEWVATLDDRTRDSHVHMNQEKPIPMSDLFKVQREKGGVDLMLRPGDPRGSAGNVINCRCVLSYTTEMFG